MLPDIDMLFVESTWMDIESIIELIPFAIHYGFNFASVLNPVHYGADILFSRKEVSSPDIDMVFSISDKLLMKTWI